MNPFFLFGFKIRCNQETEADVNGGMSELMNLLCDDFSVQSSSFERKD